MNIRERPVLPLGGRVPIRTEIDRSDKQHRAMLKQVDRLAWLLDNSIRIPIINYRIGLDAIIGLIPGIGDATGLLISSYIVMQAMRMGTTRMILMRMVFNIIIEATFGMIPILGDIFDATFKANARNVLLLRQALDSRRASGTIHQPVDKGAIVLAISILVGVLLISVGAIIALVWWLTSLA